jgi:hypothetical protein
MFKCECGHSFKTGEEFSDHVHRVGTDPPCTKKPVDWKPTKDWFDRQAGLK